MSVCDYGERNTVNITHGTLVKNVKCETAFKVYIVRVPDCDASAAKVTAAAKKAFSVGLLATCNASPCITRDSQNTTTTTPTLPLTYETDGKQQFSGDIEKFLTTFRIFNYASCPDKINAD